MPQSRTDVQIPFEIVCGRGEGFPEWSAYQWLETNPMNVPTEREVYVLNDHLPVYRMLLERI